MEGNQDWLERFPREWRGAINNWFLRFIRQGETEPKRVCHAVFALMREQAQQDVPGEGVQRRVVLTELVKDPEGALALARHGIWYESLTASEKAAEKGRRQRAQEGE